MPELTQKHPPRSPPTPRLVPCFRCGYEIPNEAGGRCPECGEVWKREHQTRQVLRDEISERFPKRLKMVFAVWAGILLVYAIGAEIAAGEYSGIPFAYAFFGIGFGVVTSLLVGLWICRLGQGHQVRLQSDAWIRSLWWYHGPWLMIGPLTLFGCIPALIYRLTDPTTGEGVMIVVVLLELLLWVIGVFVVLVAGLSKYSETLREVDLRNDESPARLHILFALVIWVGSIIVGFFGGMLGAFFMASILDPTWNDF